MFFLKKQKQKKKQKKNKNRKQKTKRKSGGMAVFIRNDLCKHFTSIETDCEYVLWFKMSQSLFNADEDVVFGTVYNPSASSNYNVDDTSNWTRTRDYTKI